MIWTIIIIIVSIILIRFGIALNKQSSDINKQGGMRKKYSELIEFFYSFNPNMKIIKETSTFIKVEGYGVNRSLSFQMQPFMYLEEYGMKEKMSFDIQHTFNSVIIHMTIKHIFRNKEIGDKERLKWEFNTHIISQENMIGQIAIDMLQHQIINFPNTMGASNVKPKPESIEIVQKKMEEAFDSLVKDALKDNPMEFSATAGMLVLSAVGNAAKYFKEQYKLEKDKICMTDKEIDNLVDEVSTRVLKKYLE